MRDVLSRWPLLVLGALVIGYAITHLADQEDPSDARALLLGVGSVLLGAGLVLVVQGATHRHGRDDDDERGTHERRDDRPGT